MKRVKIKIQNQKVDIDFEGFKGNECYKEEEKILKNINQKVEYIENKPEYYEEEKEQIFEGW